MRECTGITKEELGISEFSEKFRDIWKLKMYRYIKAKILYFSVVLFSLLNTVLIFLTDLTRAKIVSLVYFPFPLAA